jgi:speckle-type POZ protein
MHAANKDKVKRLLEHAHKKNIKVLAPHINESAADVSVIYSETTSEAQILLGLVFIDGIGERVAAEILAARSPVFHAQLCGPMMESKENIIQIDGMSAKVFEILLYYIYNDCLPKFMDDATKDATNMAQHLLVAADRYAIERLKLICESKLCKTLAISSVGYTLNLAEQYSCHDLKARCLKFIGKNREKLRSVENAGGFVQLKHNYPLLAQDALGKLTGKKKKKNQWSK